MPSRYSRANYQRVPYRPSRYVRLDVRTVLTLCLAGMITGILVATLAWGVGSFIGHLA